jgi:adenine-specific DNA-methyltransferase
MDKKQKLELTWIGKEKRPRLEPRVLVEDTSKSHHAAVRHGSNDIFDNMLIHGDNLLALKALEQQFAGKVKCIYIDPPYNTGTAFTHYDDGLEHSIWLGLMKTRLELLQALLMKEGILFISIDDDECHYLKVLCDEVFGRENFCGTFVWEKKKKPSYLSNMGVITEYILAYAKDKKNSPPFIYGTTTEGKKYPVNNAGK